MKKIYILTINDLHNVGYQTKDIEVFTDKPSATERMKELFVKAFKEIYGEDEDPFDESNTIDHQFTGDFAFIFGEYYLDIFEKEI